MKIPAFFLQLCLAWSLSLVIVRAAVPESNLDQPEAGAPALTNAAEPAAPAPLVVPGLDELLDRLSTMEKSNVEMQRSSEQASDQWEAIVQQNSALSNVLTGLQQTLITQKEREIELAKASNSLTIRVIGGAAIAVFLVFLFSYWFQLRCLNRVMEISRSMPALPHHEPVLLEQENPATSKLLSAMKMLEHRLEHLEVRGGEGMNGDGASFADATPIALHAGPADSGASSSLALLMAKGQVLLDTERLQEAVTTFQEVIAADPANAEAQLKKGIAFERMNRLEQALNCYDEAIRLNPKKVVANVYKARVLAALHRYDEAISVYDSALGKNSAKVETPIFAS